MPTPYYTMLLRTLQPEGEIPQLQYDIQNSPPAMKDITTKLFNLVTTLTYHCVALTEELLRLNVLRRTPASPAQSPQASPQARVAPQTLSPFPAPPTISLPHQTSPSAVPGAAPSDFAPCDVAQVVMTPQGSRVIPPAGSGAAPVVLPPHVPVNLAPVQAPPAPTPAVDGSAQVVLPRGGSLPPEVQAALDSRQDGPATPGR
jgi:hypothetical protein